MNTLIGLAGFFGVILFFTFCELCEILYRGSIWKEKKVAIRSLFRYWPIPICVICWNWVKNEMMYWKTDYFLPPSQEKKGGKIEE